MRTVTAMAGRHGNYSHTPLTSGWLVIKDRLSNTLAWIECPQGKAQEEFDALCTDLARAGWELERRWADNRFVKRAADRWLIGLYALDPVKQPLNMYGRGR